MSRLISTLAAALAGLVLTATRADAGQRRFVYSYETITAPKGSIEFENWVTWKRSDNDRGDIFNTFQFRHEIEFGITDRFQLGLYVFDWEYNPDTDERRKARFQHSGAEVIYNLTNPTTDFLGSALYGEFLIGEDLIELEFKVLLEKNLGPFKVVYNAILEAEWEEANLSEKKGEFAQTAGISCDLNKSFSAGAELLHEIEIPNWEEAGDSVVYAGPNVSVRMGRTFATVAGLWQVTHVEEEPDFQARLIFGIDF